ncbi:hypothetical protein HK104_002044 [Borealophlyctis nickersoniae]|nr:hypothetical protein HK104_002044 [Borealophlyctis nickersoniae]
MGNQQTKTSTPSFVAFTDKERTAIVSLYESLPAPATVASISASLSALPPNIRLAFAALCAVSSSPTSPSSSPPSKDTPVSLSAFVEAVRVVTKGSTHERTAFVAAYEQVVPNASTRGFLADIAKGLEYYDVEGVNEPGAYTPSERFIAFLIATCVAPSSKDSLFEDDSVKTTDTPKEPPLSDFTSWFPRSQIIQTLWSLLFDNVFLRNPPPNSSLLLKGAKSELLTREDVFVLQTNLSAEFHMLVWKCLFTSAKHGKSWTIFQGAVEGAGATLVVLRDKEGHVFGAFASKELEPKPKFYGDSHSFLFTLQPTLKVFRPSGINDNFQYFNYGTHTLSNGLGFGGQMDYFGLWVDSSFEKGYSKAHPVSITYNNTRLSGSEEFDIDFVEAWCIKEKEVDDRLVTNTKQSILSGNSEAEAFLEMGGKQIYSKDLRHPLNEKEED